MAKCVNCGAKLTLFNDTFPFIDGDETRFCLNCRERLDNLLLKKGMHMEDPRFDHAFVEANAAELGYSAEGVAYLHRYAETLEPVREAAIQADEEARRQAEEAERIRVQEQEYQEELRQALPNILISSGFNFDGYRIVKYSGYISGDDAVQIPRSGLFDRGKNGQNLTDALVRIRRQALKELKQAAYDLGCNAVIGVDFDYITLEPQTATITGGTLYEPYVICVTANGNAVVIEKIED